MNKRGTIVTFMPLKWYLIGLGVLILGGVIYWYLVGFISLPRLPTNCPTGIPKYVTLDCPPAFLGVNEYDTSPCRWTTYQGDNNYFYCENPNSRAIGVILNLSDNSTVGGGEPNTDAVLSDIIFYSPDNLTVACGSNYRNRDIIFYKVVSVKCSRAIF
ncbi:MAG: hypothetical protein NTX24_04890 [Candidatus Pacearchaeota archaeon]|nr:hypothetical protein [Candidatus Pacearchaeota archaeon]